MPESLSPVKQALLAVKDLQVKLDAVKNGPQEPIAIIGMGCRYPEAEGLKAFWRLLAEGMDAVSDVPADRWDKEALYDPDPSVPGKMTSRRGGFLKRLDEFDAHFFGISPREAPHVDPRQRVMLEVAWEALEEAGIPPDSLAGSRTGVFVATLTNDYDHMLFSDLCRAEAYSGAGTANSIVANRISYFLDLHGPSVALDTACSGSLVAVHLACESLRRGESTLALAGGVNMNLMPKSNVFFSKAGALSPNGKCRTFDRDADGMVRSDGAGIVVLKLLSEAVKNGDPIAAVIKGSAVNHDGRSNGIMAPNGQAQRAVLAEAYRRAGVSPGEVQYVEAHGTGTRLGDPIEVQALGAVLTPARSRDRECILGSVKTNVGHTEAASGIAGLIKASLALKHRLIPPTLHFSNPNPLIPFDELRFSVRSELGPWPCESVPLVAGVSGFGFGGTNAHVVLEEAPKQSQKLEIKAPYLLPISARTPEALQALTAAYRDVLVAEETGDVCYTASVHRTHHSHRLAMVGDTKEALIKQLERRPASSEGRLAFVFSGQGSHWTSMGSQLYHREPVFRATLDECDGLFREHAPWSLLEEISRLHDTVTTQPAIFAIQVALAALWKSWGIVPDMIAGHSLGEVAAAHAAGSITLEDAVRVVFHRSRLMKTVAGKGKTAVVGLPIEEARKAIAVYPELAVAGANSPTTSVLAGETARLGRVLASLEARGIFCRLVPGVDIAFHSPQMDPLQAELVKSLSGLTPCAASVSIISTVTGSEVEGKAFNAEYWGRNLRDPFLFAQATVRLIEKGCTTIVEVSPHPVLSSSIVQTGRQSGSVTVLPSMRRNDNEATTILSTLGKLYESGRDVKWAALYQVSGRLISLPAYPWQRQRYWFEERTKAKSSGTHPLLGELVEAAGQDLRLWEMDLDVRNPQYLGEHKVLGEPVLPGSACLEMALAAARQVSDGAVAATDVTFERALRLSEPKRIQLVLSPEGFQLFSRTAGLWMRHASGRIRKSEGVPVPVPLEEIRNRCGKSIQVESHYEAMNATGLDYGPKFRVITGLWGGNGEALGEIRHDSHECYSVHPIVLDAAFQVVAAAMPERQSYLPHGVKNWQVFGPVRGRVWCHAKLRSEPGETLEADLILINDAGCTVAQATGFRLKRMQVTPRNTLIDSLLKLEWISRQLPEEPTAFEHKTWLILGEAEALVPASLSSRKPLPDGRGSVTVVNATCGSVLERALRERGHTVRVAGPEQELTSLLAGVDGVVLLSPDCEGALRVVQAMNSGRLWLVTKPGDLKQSPLHGLGLVIRQERPELICTTVEAHSSDELLDELLFADGEVRVSWRAGVRYAARIARAESPALSEPGLRADATYLITGGLGALGLQTAKMLVTHGVRHLVLTGRSGVRGREGAIRGLEKLGAEVVVAPIDVSKTEDVRKLFKEVLASMPALRGVIHSAGVLDDGMLQQQTPDRFRKVMAPKVQGSWNLHLETKELPLDFFVCFSSAASLVGSPGQGNYAAGNAFMDALCHHRRNIGLPGLSINWGAWSDGGMAANEQTLQRMAARGVTTIDPQQGLELLTGLLRSDLAQVGVFPVDWSKFLEQFPREIPPIFEGLGRVTKSSSFALAGSREERERQVRAHLHSELARVLGFDPTMHISSRQGFFDLGMDSLMAVELKSRLEATLGITLSATVAFDYPTLEALGSYLSDFLLEKPSCVYAETSELDSMSTDEISRLLAQELEEDGVHAG